MVNGDLQRITSLQMTPAFTITIQVPTLSPRIKPMSSAVGSKESWAAKTDNQRLPSLVSIITIQEDYLVNVLSLTFKHSTCVSSRASYISDVSHSVHFN